MSGAYGRAGPATGRRRPACRASDAGRVAPYPAARVAALLALLSSLLWGGADFLGGTISRRLPGRRWSSAPRRRPGCWPSPWWPSPRAPGRRPTGYLPWAVAVRPGRGGRAWSASTPRWRPGRWASSRRSPRSASSCRWSSGSPEGERPGAPAAGRHRGRGRRRGAGQRARAVRPGRGAAGAARGAWPRSASGWRCSSIAKGSRTSTLMTLVTMRVTSVTLLAVALLVALARGAAARPTCCSARATSPGRRWSASATSRRTSPSGWRAARDMVSVVAVLGSLYPVVTVLLARVVAPRAARPAAGRRGRAGAWRASVLIAAG